MGPLRWRIFLFHGSLWLLLFFDQWIKTIARGIPSWRIHENTGIAFDLPLPTTVFFLLFFGVAGILVFFLFSAFRQGRSWDALAVSALLLGGASNAVDRLRWGAVTDVFFLPGGVSFNLADTLILFGVIFLIVVKTKNKDRTS